MIRTPPSTESGVPLIEATPVEDVVFRDADLIEVGVDHVRITFSEFFVSCLNDEVAGRGGTPVG